MWTSKDLNTQHGSTFTLSKCNAWIDSYHSHMFGMAIMRLSWRGHPPTEAEIDQLHHDYPLSASAQRLYCIGPDFEKSSDDDFHTKEENMQGEGDQ